MNLQVTTVSRTPQKVSESAAAIFVITQDDIRRSGFTSLADTLRLAPGMDVAQISGHQWAVSARGFNDQFSNKLLVMIDGRSIYTPLFAGVYWDYENLMLEDIERIEVIRGPGATLWGANAVNGVINVITKNSADTQGGLLTTSGGSAEIASEALRYGGKLGASGTYRVYGKFDDHADSASPDGGTAHDAWRLGRGGFRIDWAGGEQNAFVFAGDAYAGRFDITYTNLLSSPPYTPYLDPVTALASGGDLLGRWTHIYSDRSDLAVEATYNQTHRMDPAVLTEDRKTFDLDAQYRLGVGDRQNLTLGGGYRVSADEIGGTFHVSFDPAQRADQLFSAFAQDEITLVDKRLTLTVGTKFEHNDYSGFELQPSGRLAWTPGGRQTVWAAVSRAVRTPSRVDSDVRINQTPVFPNPTLPFLPPAVSSTFGNPNFQSEKLMAYEVGYRVQPLETLSFDVAAFYNVYDDLRGPNLYPAPTPDNPFAFVHVAPGQYGAPPANVGVTLSNLLYGETYGVEVGANWQWTDWWRWRGAYTFLDLQIHARPGSTDAQTGGFEAMYEGDGPAHQFSLRSAMDLPHDFEWDFTVRYVGDLAPTGPTRASSPAPAYLTLDARLAWRPTRRLELSVDGQNLIEPRHAEFHPPVLAVQSTDVPRSVYGKLTWHF